MTDLFDRFLDRARGTVATVQPRRPSRFEAAEVSTTGFEEIVTVAPGVIAGPFVRRLSAEQTDVTAPTTHQEPPVAKPQPPMQEVSVAPADSRPPVVAAQLPDTVSASEQPATAKTLRFEVPGPGTHLEHASPQVIASDVSRVFDVPSAQPTPPPAPPVPATGQLTPRSSNVLVGKPRFDSPVSPRPGAPHTHPRVDATREVTVSIGRIEIRAVREKERHASANRPFEPALTLEKYMERQEGGRR